MCEKKVETTECVRKRGRQLNVGGGNRTCEKKRRQLESVRKRWRQLNMDEKKEEATECV